MSIRCPICDKTKQSKLDLLKHIESMHKTDIPENMSVAQFAYTAAHGRSYGLCRACGKPTPWNEKTGKPYQLCGSLECKKRMALEAKKNMKAKYGKEHLLDDPMVQEKLLANRSISGTYTWSDGKHKFTYTGSYEKFALEWLDKVYDLNPEEIETPGPIVMYEFNGTEKPWITDMYIKGFNLVVEYKDGSFDKNTNEGFAHNRELEKAKDLHMTRQKTYNYVKVTNKNMLSLLKVFDEIRLNNIFDPESNKQNEKPIISINESIDEIPINNDISKIISYLSSHKGSKYFHSTVSSVSGRFDELYEFLNTLTESGGISLYELDVDKNDSNAPVAAFKLNYASFDSVASAILKYGYVSVAMEANVLKAFQKDTKDNFRITIINDSKNNRALIYVYENNKLEESIELPFSPDANGATQITYGDGISKNIYPSQGVIPQTDETVGDDISASTGESNMFSPRHDPMYMYNPLRIDGNFEEKTEDVVAPIYGSVDSDASNVTGTPDADAIPEITKGIYGSNFLI